MLYRSLTAQLLDEVRVGLKSERWEVVEVEPSHSVRIIASSERSACDGAREPCTNGQFLRVVEVRLDEQHITDLSDKPGFFKEFSCRRRADLFPIVDEPGGHRPVPRPGCARTSSHHEKLILFVENDHRGAYPRVAPMDEIARRASTPFPATDLHPLEFGRTEGAICVLTWPSVSVGFIGWFRHGIPLVVWLPDPPDVADLDAGRLMVDS